MRDTEVSEFIDSAYTWQERATKAEAEVERLQTLLETFNGECVVCDSVSEITKVQAENAKLRKVVEAARDVVGFGACHDENSLWSIKALQNTIENYEGWKKEGREVNEI